MQISAHLIWIDRHISESFEQHLKAYFLRSIQCQLQAYFVGLFCSRFELVKLFPSYA